jgi:hypothetical protein
MTHPSYSYDRHYATRYTFVSKGRKGAILKAVQFTQTSVKNILNLSFGDLQPDGRIDDTVNTNNNDIIKVIATVIDIVNDFTSENPGIRIVFTGSSQTRTSMYFRILKMYRDAFSKTYVITGLVKDGNPRLTGGQSFKEVPFEPESGDEYSAFFIKRKQ